MGDENPMRAQALKWLTQLRVLRGIPFQYLVPAEAALPPESVRFFHVDRNWIDAVVDGALSIAMTNDSEYAWLNENYQEIMTILNTEETHRRSYYNQLFTTSKDGESEVPSGGSITGMLFRSTIVRDYPGLEISAYRCLNNSNPWLRKNSVQTLRMERLSETIMLVIFNGCPTHVRFQEPSEGIRMGVDGDAPELGKNGIENGYELKIKNQNGEIGNFDVGAKPDTIQFPGDEDEYIVGDWGFYPPYAGSELHLSDPSFPTTSPVTDPSAIAWIKANAELYLVPPTTIPVDIRQIPPQMHGNLPTYVFDVLDIKGMYDTLVSSGVAAFFDGQDSAMVATQMLQYPYQQDFVPFEQMEDTGTPHPHKNSINWGASNTQGGNG